MEKTIKITSVYGIKDNGELVNIVVEGNSDAIPYILITTWGKKQNRNIIRQISSGSFNESIEQEIINSAQCKCGEQITVRAYCLENSAISDVWKGELQCFEIGKEAAVPVAEGQEAEEAEEGEEAQELVGIAEEKEEEEKTGLPESWSLEIPAPEEEEEETVPVAEGQEAEEAEGVEETEEGVEVAGEKGEEEEKAGLSESLLLEIPTLEEEVEVPVPVAEDQEVEEAEESEGAKELIEIVEEEEEEAKAGLWESLSLKIPAPEEEVEVPVPVAEDQEEEEVEEGEEAQEPIEIAEEEEEEAKAGLGESLSLEIPAPEKEVEVPVPVAEDQEAEEVEEGEEAQEPIEIVEEKEEGEEKISPPESLPLETPASDKEGAAIVVAEVLEIKEKSVQKSSLFPNIEITTVTGFTYNGKLVDVIVEGTSTGDKRILIKIQWGNRKYYKIVNPSSSGAFKTSFEQDIGRSAQSEGGDQITVTALSLANSAIFDIWQEKICCVEKVEETANTISVGDGVEEETEKL